MNEWPFISFKKDPLQKMFHLTDLSLCLLVFFMLESSLSSSTQQGINTDLVENQEISNENCMVLFLEEKNRFRIDNQTKTVSMEVAFQEVIHFSTMHKEKGSILVSIKAHADLPAGYVLHFSRQLINAGIPLELETYSN